MGDGTENIMKKLFVRDQNPIVRYCGGSGSPYCEPDEVCRCEAYEAENNVKIKRLKRPKYGFPSGEMEHIPLRGLEESASSYSLSEIACVVGVIILGVLFLGHITGTLPF